MSTAFKVCMGIAFALIAASFVVAFIYGTVPAALVALSALIPIRIAEEL